MKSGELWGGMNSALPLLSLSGGDLLLLRFLYTFDMEVGPEETPAYPEVSWWWSREVLLWDTLSGWSTRRGCSHQRSGLCAEAPTTGLTPFGCQSERQLLFNVHTKYQRQFAEANHIFLSQQNLMNAKIIADLVIWGQAAHLWGVVQYPVSFHFKRITT